MRPIYPAANRSGPMPHAIAPDPSGALTWAMRYTLPVAVLAFACLAYFIAWLLALPA